MPAVQLNPDSLPVSGHDAIVIGASAGGVEALMSLARELPAGLPAAVFIAMHLSPASPALLSGMIDRAGPLSASYATDGEVARPGRIYIAPADQHLFVEPGGRMRVWRGPKENGFRPAIDPLFRSVARAYGPRAIGVILSGYLDDGVLGLLLIKRQGGVAVVQDPATAVCPDMPQSAVENVDVDHVVTIDQMSALLARLVGERPLPAPPHPTGGIAMHADTPRGSEQGPIDTAAAATAAPNSIERKEAAAGPPSALTCPECGGALWQERIEKVLRYTCHQGHAYSGESLEDQYVREVEAALWTAMRHMIEAAELNRRLAGRMRETGLADRAADYTARAQETERRVAVLRELLVHDRIGNLVGRSVRSP